MAGATKNKMKNTGKTYIWEFQNKLSNSWFRCIDKVTDTGSGIDEHTLTKIFDPFFTTKFTGRGLGLSAVVGIIRGHKGSIKVESKPGEGTSFLVFFPVTTNKKRKKAESKQLKIPEIGGSGTILVVDDEEVVRLHAERVLDRAGFKVLLANDGVHGVETFREHSDEIQLVLLDLTMPRMNGEEAFREIRKIKDDVPIVLSSGYDQEEASERFGEKGLSGFIQKPYRPALLTEKLMELLE